MEIEEQLLPKLKIIQDIMQEGYDPTKYYMGVENGPFCPDCQRRHNVSHI